VGDWLHVRDYSAEKIPKDLENVLEASKTLFDLSQYAELFYKNK